MKKLIVIISITMMAFTIESAPANTNIPIVSIPLIPGPVESVTDAVVPLGFSSEQSNNSQLLTGIIPSSDTLYPRLYDPFRPYQEKPKHSAADLYKIKAFTRTIPRSLKPKDLSKFVTGVPTVNTGVPGVGVPQPIPPKGLGPVFFG